MNNMTAMVCAFVKAYHNEKNNLKIYKDNYSRKIISDEEYNLISNNMRNGIKFFNPNYDGHNPLEWIVNNRLATSVLARSIFNEKHLNNEIKLGLKQYVILGSGYDMSGYKVNNILSVFELDKDDVVKDKLNRVSRANINNKNIKYIECDFNEDWIIKIIDSGFDSNTKSYFSMLGLSYYLEKEVFKNTIITISSVMSEGSTILFDYPNNDESETEILNQKLAEGAASEMKSKYSCDDIERICEECGLLIYENIGYKEINQEYFNLYNSLNPNNKILASKGVSYCLLVKK